MWNKTSLTELLNIQYPIIQAGMAGGPTTTELVSAVSEYGGLGTIGAGYLDKEATEKAIKEVKNQTSKPFAVNLFVPEIPDYNKDDIEQMGEYLKPYRETLGLESVEAPMPNEKKFYEQIEVVINQGVPICSFTFGIPEASVIRQLKESGVAVVGSATTVDEAIAVEKAGCDAVVMQGFEAGGHRGTFLASFETSNVGTMALIPQTVDKVNIPVIAAGGIMDARGILASLALGASGVQMGTAFLTTVESGASNLHKNAVINSKENQTVLTKAFSGKLARGIYNEFIEEMKSYKGNIPDYPLQNSLTKQIRSAASKNNKPEWVHLWSGQGTRLSQNITVEKLLNQLTKGIDEQINKILN